LAMSSRNRYLSEKNREMAVGMIRALRSMKEKFQNGETRVEILELHGRRILKEHGFEPIQYLTIADSKTLVPQESARRNHRIFAAAFLGGTRLIDNVALA